MKHFLTILLIILISGCAINDGNNRLNITQKVSMIQLINNPEKYDGKKISVQGYLTIAFEENVIYFHKDDYDNSIYKNAIWLGISEEFVKKFDIHPPFKCYITVEGVYKKIDPGFTSLFSGEIEDITFMARLQNRE